MKMQHKIQLIDTINSKMLHRGDCIISSISKTNTFSWLSLDKAKQMDEEYYLGQSGYKDISVLYQNLLKINNSSYVSITENTNEIIGTTNNPNDGVSIISDNDIYKDAIAKLTSIVINKYGDKWQRLWDAFIETTYKPLENYSMVENETRELNSKVDDDNKINGSIKKSATNTDNNTYNETFGKTATNTHTFNDTITNTESGGVLNEISGTPIDKVYPSFAINSTAIKETSQDTKQETTFKQHQNQETHTGTVTDGISGSDTHTGTANKSIGIDETNTEDTSSNRDISRKDNEEIKHTRSGNIGVTTSQQMLQSEIDLRENFNIVNMMYRDLDKILTSYIWK